MKDLYDIIQGRFKADPSESYVAKLHNKGINKIAQKVGEEAAEVIIAGLKEGKNELVNESADLIFHLMVLLAERGVDVEDVLTELKKRMAKKES